VNAAQRAFKHYKVKPVFNTTLHFPVIEYKYDGNGWARHARGNRGGKLMITMREYDLDHAKVMSAIPADDPCRKLFTGGWQGFDFMFNVGEIGLSISREQIQYDDNTLAAITGRLQEVYKQFKDMIVADLNVAKNGVEYRQAVNKWYLDEVPTSFLLYLIDGKHGIKVLPGDISAITGEVGAFKDVACVHGDRSKTINRNFGSKGKTINLDIENSLVEKITYPSRINQKYPPMKSPTLVAAMGMGGGNVPVIIREGKIRKLTERECERLQTVPDNYTSSVSNSQRYKMLGNGWTCSVIAHIFKHLKIND
jgi:hypothetical protein